MGRYKKTYSSSTKRCSLLPRGKAGRDLSGRHFGPRRARVSGSEATFSQRAAGRVLMAMRRPSDTVKKMLSPSCHLAQAPYDTFPQHLSSFSIQAVDGMLLDLGMSSYQLDTPARGFAYRTEGPLDMRFDKNGPTTARHIINSWPVSELKKSVLKRPERSGALPPLPLQSQRRGIQIR